MSDKKYAYLRMVTENNNNKFYSMTANPDGSTWTAAWGRIQGAEDTVISSQTKVYSMYEWDKTYNSKVKKGYQDVTKYKSIKTLVETKNSKGVSVVSNDKHVADIITALQMAAQQQTAAVYEVKSASVTQEQIDDAQACLDNLSKSLDKHFGKSNWSINLFNKELLKLFSIIPRKMKNVNDHLITEKTTFKELTELLDQEQTNVDSMAGQVSQNTAQDNVDEDGDGKADKTLLEAMGLKMELVTDDKEMKMIRDKAQNHSHRVIRAFKVVNEKTQAAFDKNMKSVNDKKTELLWHGSRNQNWWFIIQQGLKIRPSGAVYTGSMFGDGIYFASESDKSMGYTNSGRWVNGNKAGKVYMALYNVHLGKQYVIENSDSSLSAKKLQDKGGYDSTWGKAGRSLYRHEYIIYRSEQSTIQYLIEFKD